MITATLLLGVATAFPSSAQQLPTGGSVAAGNVPIGTPQHGTLNINQSTNQAIINWNTFSVGAGGTVNFNQPGVSSATLNRVTSSTPSSIAGTINAPGTVMLVNPNGIAITKSGVINTGSFVASTLGIKNEDFLAGKYNFQGNGASAPVTNRGHINVSNGGFVALLGGRVSNRGVISAKLGKVMLGSGEAATIDLSGDGFISVAVPSNQVQNLRDGQGKALVSNKGKINANGGTVYLSAATAANALQQAVNVPGSIRANSVGVRGGKIVLNGGDGGIVNVGGTLAANGGRNGSGGSIAIAGAKISVPGKIAASGQKGGQIAVTSTGNLSVAGKVSAKGHTGQGGRIDLAGKDISLTHAKVNASGATGGGLVRIGGQFRGGNANKSDPLYQAYVGRWGALPPIAAATSVKVDAGTKIDVSARRAGDGGTVVVWSNERTSFAGDVRGTGGVNFGNGSYAEVSSKGVLDFSGRANLKASVGANGTLLLDPANVTISSSATSNDTLSGGTYSPNSGVSSSNILNTDLQTALGSSNVIVTTTNTGTAGSGNGDITVSAAVAWSNSNTLTLTAARNIAINSAITANTGTLVLSSNGGTVSQTAAISVSKLALTGAGATNTLTNTSNSIGTLAGNTGTVNLNNGANALTINTVGSTNGLTTSLAGGITLATSNASGITTTATTGTLNSSGAGPITLTANAITLNGTVTATGQTVTIVPSTAATAVTIASSGGYVTATSLGNITANTLVIGGTNAGNIAVNQALNLTSVTNLQIVSGSGNITQSAAITVSGTSSFTTSASNATITLTNASNALSGAITLSTAGTTGNVQLTNNVATTLAASTVNGNLTVQADSISATGTVNAAGHTVTLRPNTSGRLIDISTTANAAHLVLTPTTLNRISAATLVIGNTGSSGGLLVDTTAALNTSAGNSLQNITNLTLNAGGDITVNSAITSALGGALTLDAGRSIFVNSNITPLLASVGATINDAGAPGANRGTGQAVFTMASGTSITTFGGASGASGGISITTGTFGGGGSANIGDVTLAALNTNSAASGLVGGNITVTNSVGSILSQSSGTVTIQANGFSATSGNTAGTNGGTINFSAGANMGSAATALGAISATGGNAFSTGQPRNGGNGGAVTLSGATGAWVGAITTTGGTGAGGGTSGTTGAQSISASNGSITITADSLTTGSLTLTANNSTGTVTIRPLTSTTAMSINGTSALNLTSSALANITANTLVMGSTTSTGVLTVGASGAVSMPTTVTNLQLISNASSNAITLSNNLSNTKANGSITLQANSLSLGTATITANSSNGTVTILPVLASTTIGLANTAANINLSQTNLTNITAGTLIIGSTSGGLTGNITIGTSGGSATVSVGNVSNLLLANTGSGTVSELSSNTLSVGGGSGNLAVSTAGSITLGNANAVSGKVAFSAGGTVTFKATTGFTIDTVAGINGISASGQTVTLNTSTSGRTITQNQPVTASALELLGTGNTYTLTNTSNSIGTLAANVGSSGSISLTDSSALAIGTVNTAGITTGTLTLTVSSGNLTQSQAVTASGTSSFTTPAAGATITLTNTGNALSGAIALSTNGTGADASLTNNVATALAASNIGGNLTVTNTVGDLTVSGAVTASGAVTLNATGNLTIASGAQVTSTQTSGNSVVLSASGNFVNNQGSNAVSVAGSARWLIYSNAPGTDTFNNLNSANTAIWNATYATLPPGSVTASGNRYLFATIDGTNAATLTFTSTNDSKTYGDVANISSDFTVSGYQTGVANAFLSDTASTAYSGSPNLTSSGTVATATVAGSPYTINIAAGSLTSNSGYGFTFVSSGQLTVNKRPLTASIADQSKTYGSNDPNLSGIAVGLSGVVNGDNVAASLASLTRNAGETVSSYSITGGTLNALTGTSAGNYTASLSTAGNTLAITQKALTATIANQSKTYGSNDPSLSGITPTLAGVVNTTVTNWNGTSTPINDTGLLAASLASLTRAPGENVGSYAYTAGTLKALSGSSAGNYSASFSLANNPTLTINQAALTISANNASKTYGQTLTLTGTGFISNGLQFGETVGSVSLVTTGADASANAGSYAITASGATGGTFNPANYAINYVNGTLTINPQTLTITANNVMQTHNNVPYNGGNGVTYSGFVNGQNSSVLSGTIIFGGNSQGAVNVGTYTIIPSGQTSSNYAINYVNGTLTINPAPIMVGNLDNLVIVANAAGTTAPSLVTNATVVPLSPLSLPGNVTLFGNNTVLPYGDDTGAIPVNTNPQTSNTSTTNQQTSNASIDRKRRRALAR